MISLDIIEPRCGKVIMKKEVKHPVPGRFDIEIGLICLVANIVTVVVYQTVISELIPPSPLSDDYSEMTDPAMTMRAVIRNICRPASRRIVAMTFHV